MQIAHAAGHILASIFSSISFNHQRGTAIYTISDVSMPDASSTYCLSMHRYLQRTIDTVCIRQRFCRQR